MTYDHTVDAMYVQLNDNIIIRTQIITDTFFLDFDEFGEVRGIEIIHVRKQGIDPLTLVTEHYTAANSGKISPPTPEEIKAGRAEKAAAQKRYEERQAAKKAD